MTPEQIAARLTPAQRTLVLQPGGCITATPKEIAAFPSGVWQSWGALGQGRHGYELTPLGLAVRAIVEEESSDAK